MGSGKKPAGAGRCLVALVSKQVKFSGVSDSLRPIFYAQFAEDAVNMGLDGAHPHEEPDGNVVVG